MILNYTSLFGKIFKRKTFSAGLIFCFCGLVTAQTTYTFTNANATGSLGPTQSQINSAYSGTNILSGQVVSTNGIQSWTVPTTAVFRISAYGAQGGGADGGKGAVMEGDFSLTAGNVIRIVVGQQGVVQATTDANACTGGGGSFVMKGSGITLADILVIAGGGGGSPAAYSTGRHASIGASGNNGLGVANTDGAGGINGNGGNKSVLGSTQDRAAGGGGFFSNGQSVAQTAGAANGGSSFINGCNGGSHSLSGAPGGFGGGGAVYTTGFRGGGGGGGYSGGGGAQSNTATDTHSGGGGGSYNSGTNQVNTAGINIGNGKVTITELCSMNLTSSGSNSLVPSICSGSGTTLTLTTNAISNYSWSTSSTAPSITVSPTSTTVYSLSASMGSCSAVRSITVFVSGGQPTVSVVSSTNQVCLGRTATLTASGAVSYTWTGGVTNGASFNPAVTTAYTVTGQNGCGNSTAVTSITVTPLPVTASSSTPAICSTKTATLSVSSSATSFTWQPVGVFNISPNLTVSPAANTVYTITASDGICQGIANVTLNVTPTPTIAVSGGTTCTADIYTIVPGGASSYTMNGSQSGTSFTINPQVNTSYSITGTSSVGCVSGNTAVASMTLNTTPIISVNSGTICTGNSFVITPSGASAYNYSSGSATVSPPSSTVISVTGTSLGCVSASVTANVTVYITPTVAVSSGQICSGQSYTMLPSGASSYLFSSGSNVVSPNTTTSYSVTGTSAQGCVSSNTAVSNVTVNITPTVSVNSGTLCSGLSFTMNPSGAFAYVYSSGTPVVSPLSNAVYQVSGVSAQGCVSSNTAVSSVTVFAAPSVSVNSGVICTGNSFTLTPSGAFSYSFPGGGPVVSPLSNTAYTVVGSNTLGCSSIAISNITVNVSPTVTVNSGSICSGQSFTIMPAGANSYTISGGNAVVAPGASTLYNVVGTSAQGCISSNTAVSNVTVHTTPTITVNSGSICSGQSFLIVAGGASTYTYSSASGTVSPMTTSSYSVTGTSSLGCVGSNTAVSNVTVHLTPTISVNSGTVCSGKAFTINPSGADNYTFTASGPVVTPSANSTYTVSASSSLGCVAASVAISNVTVIALPIITVSSPKLLLCNGESATISATGADTYSWSNTLSGPFIVVSPTVSSSYTVTGTSTTSCSSNTVIALTVDPCTALSQLSTLNFQLNIYPNPNNGEFTIESDDEIELNIINQLGQVVKTIQVNPSYKNKVSLNDLPNGIYYATGAKDGKRIHKKILVNK